MCRSVMFIVCLLYVVSSCFSQQLDKELLKVPVLIKVRVKVVGDWPIFYQTVEKEVQGTGFLFRPDGHILTNRHVASPEKVTATVLGLFDNLPPAIKQVNLRYTVVTRDGLLFTTDYQPRVIYCVKSDNSFLLAVTELEERERDDNSRNLRIISQDQKDLLIMKVDAGMDLPHLKIIGCGKLEKGARLYALAAREVGAKVRVVVRVGETNGEQPKAVKNITGQPILMTSIAGDSGSPVIDKDGHFVGTLFANESPEASGRSFLIDARGAQELITSTFEKQEPDSFYEMLMSTIWK